MPQPETVRTLAQAYQEESRKAGRTLKLGENIGVLRGIYLADNVHGAKKLAENGMCVLGFKEVFHHFGFTEAWREPADEAKYPTGKTTLPASEVTADRIQRVKFAYMGSVDDVKRGLDELVEKANPEWFVWQGDQGFLPKDEVKRQIELFGKKLLPRYA